jgi:hypothetical protein
MIMSEKKAGYRFHSPNGLFFIVFLRTIHPKLNQKGYSEENSKIVPKRRFRPFVSRFSKRKLFQTFSYSSTL